MELAQDCARTCHVLSSVTEGRVADNLSGPCRKRIEDLGRCAHPPKPALLTVTRDTRVVRNIESAVRARDLQGYRLGSADERLIALQTEMREILRVFDVRGSWLATTTVSESYQEELGQGGALEVNETKHHVQGTVHADPPAPASVMVRYRFSTSAPPVTDCPPDVGYVSYIYILANIRDHCTKVNVTDNLTSPVSQHPHQAPSAMRTWALSKTLNRLRSLLPVALA